MEEKGDRRKENGNRKRVTRLQGCKVSRSYVFFVLLKLKANS